MRKRKRKKVTFISNKTFLLAWDKLLKQMDKMNLSPTEKELIK
jgi:hypothetical protein